MAGTALCNMIWVREHFCHVLPQCTKWRPSMLKTDEKRNANSTVYDFWAAFLFVCLGLYSEYL